MQYHLIPYQRTQELVKDVFSVDISQGTLLNWIQELSQKVYPAEKGIVQQLKQSDVVHADETGIFCSLDETNQSKLHWVHVCSTPSLTHLSMQKKRGSEAIDDIGIIGSFRGRVIHDFFSPYFKYFTEYGMCNTHLIRELTSAYENESQDWALDMINLLSNIHKRVEQAKKQDGKSFSMQTCQYYKRQYMDLLMIAKQSNPRQESPHGKRGKPKQTKVYNLIERMSKHQDEVLAFMYDFRVPFTNGEAMPSAQSS
jgi:transposase